MQSSKKLLVIYPYFFPAWKAGGPVQSLNNLVATLSKKIQIFTITSAYEFTETPILKNILLRSWNTALGSKVWYLQKKEQKLSSIKSLIQECQPQVIYINGMYSLPFVIYPLVLWKLYFKKHSRLVISPRGMLQEGALKIKAFKKTLFLYGFKFSQLHQGVEWHATDRQEALDIKKVFGEKSLVHIVPNIPKKPFEQPSVIHKKENELRLVYLSLITQKKKLHLALLWLRELNIPLVFDIYGPIKDKQYWQECVQIMEGMQGTVKVKYKGEVKPVEVQHLLSQYHALFLPTIGENFGHAIYESLSVGRPVLIGNNTPWKNLEAKKAGFDIDIKNGKTFKDAITFFYKMNEGEYNEWCNGAHTKAMEYYNKYDLEFEYLRLFNHQIEEQKAGSLETAINNF